MIKAFEWKSMNDERLNKNLIINIWIKLIRKRSQENIQNFKWFEQLKNYAFIKFQFTHYC